MPGMHFPEDEPHDSSGGEAAGVEAARSVACAPTIAAVRHDGIGAAAAAGAGTEVGTGTGTSAEGAAIHAAEIPSLTAHATRGFAWMLLRGNAAAHKPSARIGRIAAGHSAARVA